MAQHETPHPATTPAERLLPLTEVMHLTAMSRSTIYEMMARNEFPAAVKPSPKMTRWLQSDITSWMQQLRCKSEG